MIFITTGDSAGYTPETAARLPGSSRAAAVDATTATITAAQAKAGHRQATALPEVFC